MSTKVEAGLEPVQVGGIHTCLEMNQDQVDVMVSRGHYMCVDVCSI